MAEVDKALTVVGLESRAWSPRRATSRLPHIRLHFVQQAFAWTQRLAGERERAAAEVWRVFDLLQEALSSPQPSPWAAPSDDESSKLVGRS